MKDKASPAGLAREALEELSSKVAGLFPAAAGMRKDIENAVQELLQENFSRLNLLSRKELEQQFKALRRAEEQIAALEARIAELEKQAVSEGLADPADQTSGK